MKRAKRKSSPTESKSPLIRATTAQEFLKESGAEDESSVRSETRLLRESMDAVLKADATETDRSDMFAGVLGIDEDCSEKRRERR